MIGKGEITKAAQRDGLDAQTVERDYVLAHIAVHVAALGTDRLILKGGTCLRLAHYDNYRYSADLDYSLRDVTKQDAVDLIAAALGRAQHDAGLSLLELVADADPPRIQYRGPLEAKPRRIKLDLADDELVIEHARLPLVVRWRDLTDDAALQGYTLTEICAEKLRCIIQRRQCRDVYDLWSLLDARGGADVYDAWHRFERKAAHRRLEPAAFFERWDTGLAWYRDRWDRELVDYLGDDSPDFDTVARDLQRQVTGLRDYLA